MDNHANELETRFKIKFLGEGNEDSTLGKAQRVAVGYKKRMMSALHRHEKKHTQVIRKTADAIRRVIDGIVNPLVRLPDYLDEYGTLHQDDDLAARRELVKKEAKPRGELMNKLMDLLKPEISLLYDKYLHHEPENLVETGLLNKYADRVSLEVYTDVFRKHLLSILDSPSGASLELMLVVDRLYKYLDDTNAERGETANRIGSLVNELSKPFPTLRGTLESDDDALDARAELVAEQLFDNFEALDRKDRLSLFMKRGPFIDELVTLIREGERDSKQLVMFNIDADFFKAYNSAFSHDGGDAALAAISLAIQQVVDPLSKPGRKIVVGRMGGEEITGMMLVDPNVDEAELDTVLKNIHNAVQKGLKNFFLAQAEVFGSVTDVKINCIESIMESRSEELNKALHSKEKSRTALVRYVAEHEDCGFTVETFDFKEHFSSIQDPRTKREIVDHLPIGTVTSGMIRVDFGNPEQNFVSSDDLRHMYERVNGKENLVTVESFRTVFKDYVNQDPETEIAFVNKISYRTFWTLCNVKIQELTGAIARQVSINEEYAAAFEQGYDRVEVGLRNELRAWKQLLDVVEERRAGRLIDRVDGVQEDGKKKERGVTHRDPDGVVKIQTIDEQTEASTQDIKDIVANALKSKNQELVDQLYQMSKEERFEAFKLDPRLERVDRMGKVVKRWYKNNASSWFSKPNPETRERRGESLLDRLFGGVLRVIETTQRDRYREALTFSLNDDFLYGVCSRLLSEYYTERAKKKSGWEDLHFSVVSYDFDNLKAVNESGGHFQGDVILRLCALNAKKILKQRAEKAMLVRVGGGEEFVIVAPSYSSEHIKAVMEEINQANKQSTKEVLSSVVIDEDKVQELFKKWKLDRGAGGIEATMKQLLGRSVQSNSITMYDLSQVYIAHFNKLNGPALENIGTVTSGVVDVADVPRGIENLKIEKIRQVGDIIGEEEKKAGRKGGVVTLSEALKRAGIAETAA